MTPDPTLAARLTGQLQRLIDHPSIPNFETLHQSLYDAYRAGQLITLADADAMVRAENEACAKAVQPNGHQPECCRDTMSAIASAIRARVQPHNNDVA
jgi:hypothetical protein